MSYNRSTRVTDQQYYNEMSKSQLRNDFKAAPPAVSNIIERVEVPLSLQEWASGKEIQSILFKVKMVSGVQSMHREIGPDGPLFIVIIGNDSPDVELARILLLTHFKEQAKYQEQYKRLQELEDCLHEAMAETVTGRSIEVMLPKQYIGSIIGKKGANIQEIMKQTGATITVDSETATANITGPSVQSVQDAKDLLDYTEVKIPLATPLAIPSLLKQTMFDLMSFVTNNIKQATGCTGARLASTHLGHRKREKDHRDGDRDDSDEDEDYVVFVGPRDSVVEAENMLNDKLKDLEREKIEHEAALQTMADAEAAAKLKAEEERAELAARNIDISLPKELIGSIIGKKGANIHDIMKRTGTNITVHSDIARAHISGPSREAVQRARVLMDIIQVQVPLQSPLPLPPPQKQSLANLITYVTNDLKQQCGCMTARVVAPSFSRGKEATYDGTGESYVSFLGPRDTVEMATDLLKKKLTFLETEKDRIEAEMLLNAQAEAEAALKAKQEAEAQARASGKYVEVALVQDMLGFIIGKKRSNLINIMESSGANVVVNSESARATVTGPTAEAVNKAVALLDFVREKVPLPNPPLRKAELQALCSYVLNDIKHGSGCTSARVITSQLLQRRKGAEQETHEPGEYCVFMGPRECVAKAVEMLGDRYEAIGRARIDAQMQAEIAAYPPLSGQCVQPLDASTAPDTSEGSLKSWAAVAKLRPPVAVREEKYEDDGDENDDEGDDDEEEEQQEYVSSRRRGTSASDESSSDEHSGSNEEYSGSDDDEGSDSDDDDEGSDEESCEEYSGDEEEEGEEEEWVPGVPDFQLPLDLKCATVEINKIIIGLLGRVAESSTLHDNTQSNPLYVVGVEQTRKAIALGYAGIVFVAPEPEEDRNISIMVSEAKASGTAVMYALNSELMGQSIRSGRTHNVVTVCKMETPVGLYNVLCRFCR